MILHSLTATFGKLQGSTLTLQPGLNVITAPNEWGKSTWCAFLVAMLYGIDTRQRTTDSVLADKERYAPWSGQPMSGRIELSWQGRGITLERTTKGRTPMGQFRAYETATGLPVPELTADNCGRLLLGVEKEVFLRAGFIRLTELPVTQSEALRRRLNALVTTGDDRGEADQMAARLQKLKNTVRSNSRTGLLPQEQARLQAVTQTLHTHRELTGRIRGLTERTEQQKTELQRLYAHRQALQSRAAAESRAQLQEARERLAALDGELRLLQRQCDALPEREQLRQQLLQLEEATAARQALLLELQMLPDDQKPPHATFCQPGEDPENVARRLTADQAAQQQAQAQLKKRHLPLWLPGLLLLAGGIFLWPLALAGAALVALGLGLFIRGKKQKRTATGALEQLQRQYGPEGPLGCEKALAQYRKDYQSYQQAGQAREASLAQLRQRHSQQTEKIAGLCGASAPEARLHELRDGIALWDRLADALREHRRLGGYVRSLEALCTAPAQAAPEDTLTLSQADTDALISDHESRLRQGQQELARLQGQRDALGEEAQLTRQQAAATARIERLSTTLEALELALSTLSEATRTLQQRFAPQLTQQARGLMAQLTEGRYDRLVLDEELQLLVGAQDEATLRDPLWRSDGTADQLYLALRLAVAQVLTPDAPLVLDDALVRFDDKRLQAALHTLQTLAQTRQVILFSCQDQEQRLLS